MYTCNFCNVECFIMADNETINRGDESVLVEGVKFYQCPLCKEEYVDKELDDHNSILISNALKN